MWLLTLCFLCCASLGQALPQFEAYWESQESYLYNDDEQHNPWYIDLGAIASGPPGNLHGPSTVTIGFADTCVEKCQEEYPDEFCSKYPPEGVPARPRTVNNWGTKFNITSQMMTKGIAALKAKGTKVNLSYGKYGLRAMKGGGQEYTAECVFWAQSLARRMAQNVEDWNLDGVDVFVIGGFERSLEGVNSAFHYHVFKHLRILLPAEKTISYSIFSFNEDYEPMETVIAAAHKYMDYINIHYVPDQEYDILHLLTSNIGVPASKIGWMMSLAEDSQNMENIVSMINSIKEKGLRGLSFFSINQENNARGEFLKQIAENLYG